MRISRSPGSPGRRSVRVVKYMKETRSLRQTHPQLVKEWHPTKNLPLNPEDVTRGSGKKVWWRCRKNDDHVWQSNVLNRTSGNGCPFCAGKAVSKDNNLAAVAPGLAKEWHKTKNGDFKPTQVVPGSEKKVWWQCSKNIKHVWLAKVVNRWKGHGCIYCASKAVHSDESLKVRYPELAKEWYRSKNMPLRPDDVLPGANKKVYWRCARNSQHVWQAVIANRALQGAGCPYCSNRKMDGQNSLAKKNPTIAKEWHPTKNSPLTPDEVPLNSAKKVWWQCLRHPDHEWLARIATRVSLSRGCPYCTSHISKPALRIYSELESVFENVELQKKIAGVEYDIWLPDFRIGIEYDGFYWHRNSRNRDLKKNLFSEENGIQLIRVREGLAKMGRNDILVPLNQGLALRDIKQVFSSISKIVGANPLIARYLDRKAYANDSHFLKLERHVPNALPGRSLADIYPEVAKTWHLARNAPLLPADVYPGTKQKVWWQCQKNNEHIWQASVCSRIISKGCPSCLGRRATSFNNLTITHPNLLRTWFYERNKGISPERYVAGSGEIVWWICENNPKHVWQQSIVSRVKSSPCPFCFGRKVGPGVSLKDKHPRLAEEWDYKLNGRLRPDMVRPGSKRKVWWVCTKKHSWQAAIYSRVCGTGCPHCYRDRTGATS